IDYINEKRNITNAETSWIPDLWATWILVSKKTKLKSFEKQINDFASGNIKGRPASIYSLQNLSDVYLHSGEIGSNAIHGNLNNVRIFSAIAFLIILVAAINYIILSTAISTKRIKEISVRKTFGASIEKILKQFLSESLSLISLVFPLALFLMWIMLPKASSLFQVRLHIMNSNLLIYIFSYLILVIAIGIASGSYISVYIARLNILDIINNSIHLGRKKTISRSFLIILQLMIFCSALAASLIIRSQYKYELNKDLGYYNKNILLIDLGKDFNGYPSFLNSIRSMPDVIMAAGTNISLPMVQHTYSSLLLPNFENPEIQVLLINMNVDFNFFKTMGMSITKGRDFSDEFLSDIGHSIILNEKAVNELGLTDPIGQNVVGEQVIGIVKDFNLFSLHSEILPLVIYVGNKTKKQIVVHYKSGTLNKLLPKLKKEWVEIAPDKSFSFKTIEGVINELYSSEKNLTNIVTIFAILSLLISAFGLFGLTFFLSQSRNKEIGIKKVFGSSENEIIVSFLLENIVPVIIATLLSIPIIYYFMTKWLNQFAFKIKIGGWVFVLAFLSSTFVVIVTVLYHSYKVSRINPVKVLRYE
ncbi:MAG TPA: FtsX-like permease family protein, partial [Ignavibacteriaceae bacterium]|nr:FtsX-like permease family protein [Ignavibacteriaceae bacterium]